MVCTGRAEERRTPLVIVFRTVKCARDDAAKRGCGAWVAAAGREEEEGTEHGAAEGAADTFRGVFLLLSGSVNRGNGQVGK